MVKRKLLNYLVLLLDRKSTNLEILVLAFLKKLAVIEENSMFLAENCAVEKVAGLIPCSSEAVTNMSSRLLFNVSFQKDARLQIVQAGLLPRLSTLLKEPPLRARILR